jgi:hypothetical protein
MTLYCIVLSCIVAHCHRVWTHLQLIIIIIIISGGYLVSQRQVSWMASCTTQRWGASTVRIILNFKNSWKCQEITANVLIERYYTRELCNVFWQQKLISLNFFELLPSHLARFRHFLPFAFFKKSPFGLSSTEPVNQSLNMPEASRTVLKNRWHKTLKWHPERLPSHAAFTPVPIFLFLLTDQRLYFVNNIYIFLWRIYIYTYLTMYSWYINYRCYKIMRRVKHFYTNREQCEVLTGYVRPGRRPGIDWANTWHRPECFTSFLLNRK